MKTLTIEAVKKNWKRYLFSSVISFLAGFLMFILANIDTITLESFKDGSVLGLLFVGVRVGIKAVLEFIFKSSADTVGVSEQDKYKYGG